MTQNLSADLERDMRQGTWDKERWEGKVPAEPKATANGDWRMIRQQQK